MQSAWDLAAALRPENLRPAYQPLIALDTGEVVGFEALARWPTLPGANPDAVFALARSSDRISELDWACRLAAIDGALRAGANDEQALFVNVEPAGLGRAAPEGAADVLARAQLAGLRVIVELTERSLLARPAQLLQFVQEMRGRGWGIALDDVGAHPDSLALLPLLQPDVIKLDLALIQGSPSRDQARTLAGILAHAERRGTAILAEGVETAAHVEQAVTFGARYGQGWYYGPPGPLAPASVTTPLALADRAPATPDSPFDLVAGRRDLRVGRKHIILAMSKHLETQAASLTDPPVVLAAFQTAARFTPTTAARYARLAESCPMVAALGIGLPDDPAPGVRGTGLRPDDPLVGEWTVVVVGAHYAGALIARDLGDTGVPDSQRRFSFVVTHDRDAVVAAGRSLMGRVIAA